MPRRRTPHDSQRKPQHKQRRDARRARPQRPKPKLDRRGAADSGGGSVSADRPGRADAFRCAGCGLDVPLAAPGTAHRNHCPHCLASRHVDLRIPGDRGADCRGRMAALSVTTRTDGEWLLIHRCHTCGALSANRIAGDDNPLALLRLALRPLADAGVPARAVLGF